MTSRVDMITHSSRPLIYASGLALLWLVLALLSSDTTYHLAPLLVAGVPPTFEGTHIPGLSWKTLAKHSLTGLSLALVTTLVLSLSGLLAGPSLFPVGGAAYESVVLSIAGALAGFGAGSWMTRRPQG